MAAAARSAIPTHIPTWAYDEYHAEGADATAAQVRALVTYAEGGLGNDKALADCASSSVCASVWYFDPNKIYDSTVCPDAAYAPFVAQAKENWYVHVGGARVRGHYKVQCSKGTDEEPVWIANTGLPAVQAYFRNYLQTKADAWEYYLMDDTSGTVADQMYGPGGGFCNGALCSRTDELPDDAAVVRSHAALAEALDHRNGQPMRFFFNGLSFDGAQNANDIGMLQSSSRFVGALCENCIVSANVLQPKMYAPVLNAMATIATTTHGIFVLLSTGNAPSGSSSQIAQRLVTTAIVWLGYVDNRTVVWPNLEYATHGLAVWPEDMLYPAQALQTMHHDARDLQVAPGVWRREFGMCYKSGIPIGSCAAIVNATGTAVTVRSSWLRNRYKHSVQLIGGDVLSGGSVSLRASFSAGRTTVASGKALLLMQ